MLTYEEAKAYCSSHKGRLANIAELKELIPSCESDICGFYADNEQWVVDVGMTLSSDEYEGPDTDDITERLFAFCIK